MPLSLGDFLIFPEKNNYSNAIWITFRTFLKLFERIKLLRLKSQWKILLNIQSLRYLQINSKTRLNACILALKIFSDLAEGGGGGGGAKASFVFVVASSALRSVVHPDHCLRNNGFALRIL